MLKNMATTPKLSNRFDAVSRVLSTLLFQKREQLYRLSLKIMGHFVRATTTRDTIKPDFSHATFARQHRMDAVGEIHGVMGFAIPTQFRYGGNNYWLVRNARKAAKAMLVSMKRGSKIEAIPT